MKIQDLILFENDRWLAVNKPSGVSSEGVVESIENQLQWYFRSHKLVKGYPKVINRLDRPTSGIILLAKKKQALRLFQKEIADRKVQKYYLAIVEDNPPPLPKADTLMHGHHRTNDRRKAIITPDIKDHQVLAKLWYRELIAIPHFRIYQIRLFTGRFHQIRAQFAALQRPVRNDTLYGAEREIDAPIIGLHAWKLVCTDPQDNSPIKLIAPVPKHPLWPTLWQGSKQLDKFKNQ